MPQHGRSYWSLRYSFGESFHGSFHDEYLSDTLFSSLSILRGFPFITEEAP